MEMDELRELLNKDDRFCRFNGMRLDVLRTGYAEAVMEITENSLNGVGIAQGGAIFTLADLAFAGAANSYGFRTVGMNSTINFLRPGLGKETARVVDAGGGHVDPRHHAAPPRKRQQVASVAATNLEHPHARLHGPETLDVGQEITLARGSQLTEV